MEEIKIETLNRIFVLKCSLIVSSVSKLSTLVTWITELTARNMCPNSPVLHAPPVSYRAAVCCVLKEQDKSGLV